MNARFYAPGPYSEGSVIDLPDEEAQHAIRVLRLGVGSGLNVFDGLGHEFLATIVGLQKHSARVAIENSVQPARESGVAITLVQAVLKGDKMDDVVRDAVMMGAVAIQPVVTDRSEASIAALERGHRTERWQRVALASTKQCGRAIVPPVAAPVPLSAGLALESNALSLMCVEPGAAVSGLAIASLPQQAPQAVRVFVGPEGGWTRPEIAMLTPAATLVTLGAPTLRADAMALVAIAALFTHWGEL